MTIGYHIVHILNSKIERTVNYDWVNGGSYRWCFDTLKAVGEIHRCYPVLGYETILMSVCTNVYLKPWDGRGEVTVRGKTACARELDKILTAVKK